MRLIFLEHPGFRFPDRKLLFASYFLPYDIRTGENCKLNVKYAFCLFTNRSDYDIMLEQLKNRYSSLAQLVEHAAVNRRVVGSSPTGGAIKKSIEISVLFFILLNY